MQINSTLLVELRPIAPGGHFAPAKLPLRAPYRGSVINADPAKFTAALATLSRLDGSVVREIEMPKSRLARRLEEEQLCASIYEIDRIGVVGYSFTRNNEIRKRYLLSAGACKALSRVLQDDLLAKAGQLENFQGAVGDVRERQVPISESSTFLTDLLRV